MTLFLINFPRIQGDLDYIDLIRNLKKLKCIILGSKVNKNLKIKVRKPGMSLINPMVKRRKAPKGVKFDDDENVDVDVENSSESNDSSTKFVRTLSNVSSQSQND